jgi:hypothetical protein
MSRDGFGWLAINEDLNSFDLGKIEGKRVHNRIDGHQLA